MEAEIDCRVCRLLPLCRQSRESATLGKKIALAARHARPKWRVYGSVGGRLGAPAKQNAAYGRIRRCGGQCYSSRQTQTNELFESCCSSNTVGLKVADFLASL